MHNRQNRDCDSLFKKVKHISGDFDKGIEFDTSFSNLKNLFMDFLFLCTGNMFNYVLFIDSF